MQTAYGRPVVAADACSQAELERAFANTGGNIAIGNASLNVAAIGQIATLPNGNFPNHVGLTSWALWALACYGIPAHRTEIEFLLKLLHGDRGHAEHGKKLSVFSDQFSVFWARELRTEN